MEAGRLARYVAKPGLPSRTSKAVNRAIRRECRLPVIASKKRRARREKHYRDAELRKGSADFFF